MGSIGLKNLPDLNLGRPLWGFVYAGAWTSLRVLLLFLNLFNKSAKGEKMQTVNVYLFEELSGPAKEKALANYPACWLSEDLINDIDDAKALFSSLMEDDGFKDAVLETERYGSSVECTIDAEDLEKLSPYIVIADDYRDGNINLVYSRGSIGLSGNLCWLPDDEESAGRTEDAIMAILGRYLQQFEDYISACEDYRNSDEAKEEQYSINEVLFSETGHIYH